MSGNTRYRVSAISYPISGSIPGYTDIGKSCPDIGFGKVPDETFSALNEHALFFQVHRRSERLDSSVREREPNAWCRMHVKIMSKTRNTLSQEEGSFDSQNRCKITNASAGEPRQGAIYLQNKYSSCCIAFIRSVLSVLKSHFNRADSSMHRAF